MPMRCEKYKVFVMPNNLDRWDDSFFLQLGKKQLKRRLDYADDADGTLFRFEDSPLVWRTYLTVVMDKSQNGRPAQVSSVANLFSSHPDTQSRIDRGNKKASADGYTRPTK